MAGEHRTQIRDDQSSRAVMHGTNQNHLHIILYESTVYLLRIQVECSADRTVDSQRRWCNLPYEINAWIDLNDDGIFSESENAAPYRWPLNSYIPQGIVDLQIVVPAIDQRNTKVGKHRMRLIIMLNEEYREKCGKNHYSETRDYTVTIVPRWKKSGKPIS